MKFSFALVLVFLGLATNLQASYDINFKDKKVLKSDYMPKMSAEEHYNAALQAMEHKNWRVAQKNFMVIHYNFANTQVGEDVLYFLALCDYHLEDLDLANKKFTEYLNSRQKLRYFEESLSYKYAIAEKFLKGAKKHLFESEKMPKWADATDEALELLDDIIAAVPNHELAAKCMNDKARYLLDHQEFKESLDLFQDLTRKFPKHPTTVDAYLAIAEAYFIQSHSEYHNTDLLELAEMNLKKFTDAFPREEKLQTAKDYLSQMEEIHAKGLYDTGLFYERTKKPKASVIYYTTALEKFPNAPSTERCKNRLLKLDSQVKELQVAEDLIQL